MNRGEDGRWWLKALAVLCACRWSLVAALAQSPALTTVRDTVYRSDGAPASGSVVITWQAFVSADNRPVFGGTKTVPLSSGALAVSLVPNAGGTPSGTSYRVRYYQSGGLYFEETWVVPTSNPVAPPSAPTVAPQGATGSTTYCYWISATNASGETLPGINTCIANGNASLNATNFNQVSWVPASGATGYKVYRTPSAGLPSGAGNYLVGSTMNASINDQSSSLASVTIPSVNTTDPRGLSAVRVSAPPSQSVLLAPAQVMGTSIVSNPTATQTITAPTGSGIPLRIAGRSGNVSNAFEVYDNQATPQLQSYFDPGGALFSSRAPTFSQMNSGSLLFAGSGGLLSQDASNLNWDNAAKSLRVGPRNGFSTVSQSVINFARHSFGLINPASNNSIAAAGVVQDNSASAPLGGLYGFAESAHSTGLRSWASGVEGDGYHTGTGTISTLLGVFGYAENSAGVGGNAARTVSVGTTSIQSGASTTTDLVGLEAFSNGRSGGTVTNNYGIKVDDQTVGTNNWAIKTGIGKVEFGDKLVAKAVNSVRMADQFPGSDAGARIAAAIADLPSTGGTVDACGLEDTQAAAATITIDKPTQLRLCGIALTLAGSPGIDITAAGVAILGQGRASTVLVTSSATADIIRISPGGAFAKVTALSMRSSVARTDGAAIDQQSGNGNFENLRMDKTYYGILLGRAGAGNNSFVGIDMGASQSTSGNWRAGIWIGGGQSLYSSSDTGTIASNRFVNIAITVDAAFSIAAIVLEGGTDTAQFTNVDVGAAGADSDAVRIRNTTSLGPNPRWIRFTNSGFEAGPTKTGITLDAATDVSCIGCYIASSLIGINVNGTTVRGLRYMGGSILNIQDQAVLVQGGTDIRILHNRIADTGLTFNNAWSAVQIVGGITDFSVIGNDFGNLFAPSNKPDYFVKINSGGSDRYVIFANHFPSGDRGTGDVSDSGLGANKIVEDGNGRLQTQTLQGHLQAVTFSTTPTFDASLGNSFKMTLTANISSSTLSNGQAGELVTLLLCQDATGNRTMSWPSNLKLAGGSFTFTVTPNKCDSITALFDGVNWYETARAANL